MPDTNDFVDINDMEVFKEGTHNGHKFTDKDIDGIVDNFNELQGKLVPKVKISHGEKQESIAGLASYGDVTKVVARSIDGIRKIFVDLTNVPEQVAQWIKDSRFGERSVEIFPSIKIGGKQFKNVLAKVALLGHQIPAVAGMEPVTVNLSIDSDLNESEYGRPEHFEYKTENNDIIATFSQREEDKLNDEHKKILAEMQTKLDGMAEKLNASAEGKELFKQMNDEIKNFKVRVETAEAGTKTAEANVTKLTEDNEKKDEQLNTYKKKESDALSKLKTEKISNFTKELKTKGKITPVLEKELVSFFKGLDDSEKTYEFTTKLQSGEDVQQKETQLEFAKRIFSKLPKSVEFNELLTDTGDNLDNAEGGTKNFVTVAGTEYPVDGVNEEVSIQKYMTEFKVDRLEASRVILDAKEKRDNK